MRVRFGVRVRVGVRLGLRLGRGTRLGLGPGLGLGLGLHQAQQRVLAALVPGGGAQADLIWLEARPPLASF